MNSQPLISIFIPIYNGGEYFADTLESLLSQTYSNFEIIIVNDGSTDTSGEIASKFERRDARVRIITLERNQGAPAARNIGWKSANPSAKYLLNHDSDDISNPNKLERLLMFLESHKEISAVGSFCRYVNERGEDIGFPPLEWKPDRIRKTNGMFNSIVNSATLVRREVYDVLGGFQTEYRWTDDYDFWSRMLLQGFVLANIPEFLHNIRVHRSSITSVHTQEMEEQARAIRNHYQKHCSDYTGDTFAEKVLHKILRKRMLLGMLFNRFVGL
ncbi:MAG: glycosyltransferase family 2 protein [Bacteroidetes bacterium]|nr:MAG: glycosyltransferase family 2 protein [Bacteroidota bacterium]